MSGSVVPSRHEVDRQYTWNAESVFATPADWEVELERLGAELPDFRQYQGRLGESAAVLREALSLRDELRRRAAVLQVYAGMAYNVDTLDQVAGAASSRADALVGKVAAVVAFVEPEVLSLGWDTLAAWMEAEPGLAMYRHYFEDLFRKQDHVRSAEVEELLGMLVEPFGGAGNTFSLLTNADFKFRPAAGSDGVEQALTQSTYLKLLASPDREVRRTAWENYHDLYVTHRHALTSAYATSVKQSVLATRARRHSSTLAASLFPHGIPVSVFHNLIDVFKKNLPTWHRYWRVRRRVLGVEALQPYDTWAPLTSQAPVIPFRQAVDWICEGLAPLGDDYVATMRKGCLEGRWIDLYPNQGKRAGAFSWGAQGTPPFIMMSYGDNTISLSTLAHELGHSMHSYLTWQHQPAVYSEYSLFLAEVASNFHQAMVRGRLLATTTDPLFQISVVEEAMTNFYRYFLVMPTLARFELEVHERIEAGRAVTPDELIALMVDLYEEAFGGEMVYDRNRLGMNWATFGHLYEDYYVFQYATGISGAHALARRIMAGAPGAAEAYRRFLSSGSSLYPLDALALAGVDLSSPAPVEEAFAVLNDYVDRLERWAA